MFWWMLLEKLGSKVVSCQADVGKALLEELVLKALLLQAFLPEGLSQATCAKLKLIKVEAVLNDLSCKAGCLLGSYVGSSPLNHA